MRDNDAVLWKREENDDIINSASDVEGKCPQGIGKKDRRSQ